MAKKSAKRKKSKPRKRRYVNRRWAPKYTERPKSDCMEQLKGDSSCVLLEDPLTDTLFVCDEHAAKTQAFEDNLIKHIKQRSTVMVIVSKSDIEASNVWLAEQTISTISNARHDGLIGPREGVVQILPHGTGYKHLTGFEAECKVWCKELVRQVPEWWYFVHKTGKFDGTTAYWMTVNISERLDAGTSKFSATKAVLDSVNSLPDPEEDERAAVRWMKRSGLLLSTCRSREGLEEFKKMSKLGVRVRMRGEHYIMWPKAAHSA